MRKLSELYKILLNLMLEEDHEYICGICKYIIKLFKQDIISLQEYEKLMEHFKSHKPTSEYLPQFYDANWCSRFQVDIAWWWRPSEMKPRLYFVKKLISIAEEEEENE